MKMMSDRKMGMGKGEPDSEGFFPEQPHMKKMARAGEIKSQRYPDTEEAIHADQEQMIGAVNRGKQKDGFRH